MDNVGDWLYIVFLIIAAISGLFSSKKKKNRPEVLGQPDREIMPDDERPTQEKGFWEILEEMREPEPPKPISKTPTRQEHVPQAPPTPPEVSSPPSPYLATEKDTLEQALTRPYKVVVPPMAEPAPTVEVTFNDPEELRKAVIYAEILNRKY